MEMVAMGVLIMEDMYLNHSMRRSERSKERKRIRDNRDPFEMDNDYFIHLFRLSKDAVHLLIERLGPHLERQRPYGISVKHQVLAALRYYAKGCHQDAVGEQLDIGLSQPSVSRCIRDVTEAINTHLLREHVRFPMTPEERHAARVKFQNCRQPFPGAIGATDCTYIQIIGPKIHEEAYVNHHGNHSLNIQVICDPDLKILNVNARYPGARIDFFIWKNCAVRRALELSHREGERNFYLIGDDGYFIEPWLMTPLKHELAGTPKFAYNEALCNARCVVERLFGVLKSEFRCIASSNTLLYTPEMAAKIFNACCVLHNMRVELRLEEIVVDAEEVAAQAAANAANPAPHEEDAGAPLTYRALGQRVRSRLINQHFS